METHPVAAGTGAAQRDDPGARIRTAVGARSGLVGNPSDLFGGKVISLRFDAFSAGVTLYESARVTCGAQCARHHQFPGRGRTRPLPPSVRLLRRHPPDRGPVGPLPPLLRGARHQPATAQLHPNADVTRRSWLYRSSRTMRAHLRALGGSPRRRDADANAVRRPRPPAAPAHRSTTQNTR